MIQQTFWTNFSSFKKLNNTKSFIETFSSCTKMSVCDSEENRRKLAWLVPGYILLAWFFCVLFQPLSIHSPALRSRYRTYEKNYEVIYLDAERSSDLCNRNEPIILEAGPHSAVIIRLSKKFYHYKQFNCSLQIKAGKSLDGLTAVVEEMDFREHEDDFRKPGGHWGSTVCLDYLEVWTDKQESKKKLCGTWDVGNERLSAHGSQRNLFGYCYDEDGKSKSCEARSIFLNAAVDWDVDLTRLYGLQLDTRERRGFSVVVTGYKHGKEVEATGLEMCEPKAFTCPTTDFSAHEKRVHCIWSEFRCDGHQNCGFNFNSDESDCTYPPTMSPWSISTMSLLIVVYMTIVLILVLVTILLLRWNRALRSPIDILDPSSDNVEAIATHGHTIRDTSFGASAAPPPTSVSIMVMYRPKKPVKVSGDDELPPSYESLYMGENPPSYNVVTVNLPPEAAAAAANCQPGGQGTLPVPLIVPFSLGRVSLNATFGTENAPSSGDSWTPPSLESNSPKNESTIAEA